MAINIKNIYNKEYTHLAFKEDGLEYLISHIKTLPWFVYGYTDGWIQTSNMPPMKYYDEYTALCNALDGRIIGYLTMDECYMLVFVDILKNGKTKVII